MLVRNRTNKQWRPEEIKKIKGLVDLDVDPEAIGEQLGRMGRSIRIKARKEFSLYFLRGKWLDQHHAHQIDFRVPEPKESHQPTESHHHAVQAVEKKLSTNYTTINLESFEHMVGTLLNELACLRKENAKWKELAGKFKAEYNRLSNGG